eukprot:TRINITY_DN39812_c0_g1_i1.p1 TRINITY_DN39812_c0_g1~~TRINITY_DN39812_c0_g1_i1.p1  ORF type:complete len:321 (+),score=58.06 TRINITY_DN39812_c0_g1_i1:86-1048(+)
MDEEEDDWSNWLIQPWIAWAEFFAAPGSRVCTSAIGDGRSGERSKLRELCLPRYLPTRIEALEARRGKLALALTGQVAVIAFRLLCGDIGGGCMGAVVFLVGNTARCWLQYSSLTGFVVLGSASGVLDAATLAHHATELGSGLFSSSPEQALLGGISMLLAPVTELSGAYAAWRSYPSASMLFLRPGKGISASRPQLLPLGDSRRGGKLQQPLHQGSAALAAIRALAGSALQLAVPGGGFGAAAAMEPRGMQKQQRPRQPALRIASDTSSDGRRSRRRRGGPAAASPSCQGCGQSVPAAGAGAADSVYCHECWLEWRSNF